MDQAVNKLLLSLVVHLKEITTNIHKLQSFVTSKILSPTSRHPSFSAFDPFFIAVMKTPLSFSNKGLLAPPSKVNPKPLSEKEVSCKLSRNSLFYLVH